MKLLSGMGKIASFGLAILWSNKGSNRSLKQIKKNTAETVKELNKTNAHLKAIDKEIKELNLSIEEQNLLLKKGIEIAKESLLVQRYIALQQDKDRIYNRQKEISKHNLEQQSKFLREAFFQLKQELDLLEKPKVSNLEKYLSTESISLMLSHHKVSTKLTDDLFEKQLIQDSFNKLKEINKNSLIEFDRQDKSDIKLIKMIVKNEINIEEKKLSDLQNKRKSMNKNYKSQIKNLNETQNLAFILRNHPKIVTKVK